jgi:glutamine synthetase adenylyltransferase
MKNLSTRRLMIVSSFAIALAIAGAPSTAGAASTRAEYIAQVDPICQSFVAPVTDSFKAYHRAFKTMNRRAKTGPLKAFFKSIRRTASTLNTIAQVHLSMLQQIAAVPPPSADMAQISAWTTALGQEQANEVSATTALRQFRFGVFFKRLGQADAAVNAAATAISGFGFTVCSVAVS